MVSGGLINVKCSFCNYACGIDLIKGLRGSDCFSAGGWGLYRIY